MACNLLDDYGFAAAEENLEPIRVLLLVATFPSPMKRRQRFNLDAVENEMPWA
jgi:hypothetical protein